MVQKSMDSFVDEKASKRAKRRSKPTKGDSPPRDLSYYEGMLDMYREIGHTEGEVDTQLEIALLHLKKNAVIRALKAAEKARLPAMELSDEREAATLLLIGDIRYLARDLEDAKESWSRVIENPEATEEQRLGAFLRLAVLTHEKGDRDFINWIQKADDISETPEAALLRGMRLRKEGRTAEAEEWFLCALTRQSKGTRPMTSGEITILPEVTETAIYKRVGELREEAGRLREASEAYERAGDYMARGRVLHALGNLELALKAFEAGRKKTGGPEFIVKQAELIIEMGDEEGGLRMLRRGEKELENKDLNLLIQALNLEMAIYEGQGRYLELAETLEKRGKACEALQEFEGMAGSYLKAAEILKEREGEGAWKRAVNNLRKVIESAAMRGKIDEELGYRLRLEEMHLRKEKPVKNIYEENVRYCYSLRRPELAVEFFQGELRLHKGREKEFPDYLHLARAHLSGGRKTEALTAYQEALKHYSDPAMRGTIDREMGYLYRVKGDTEKAIGTLDNALNYFKRAKNREGRIKALTELEKVYDDLTVREKLTRSRIISEINKTSSRMERLTEEAVRHQRLIRESTKLMEEQERELREWKGILKEIEKESPEGSNKKRKDLEKMERLGDSISRGEEKIASMQGIINENLAKKLGAQEEKADLKLRLMEIRKKDAEMKKKVEAIELKAKEFREQAMALDPMLSTSAKLETIEEDIYHQLAKGTVPRIRIPTRTKDNIEFSEHERVYRYSSGLSFRSAKSTDGANMLMRTAYVIDFIDDMIRSSIKGKNRTSTLRELYYISESWGKLAKFGTQNESNNLVEDLEIMTSYLRENFHLRPEEDGAKVIGNITLREKNRKGEWKTINCREDVGDSGYTIPYNAEKEKLQFKGVDADFVIAIETGGMFDRLVENGFDEGARAVLVHIKGQPARSTRRFLKRLNGETRLPVLVFTDGDPWSYRIFASIAYGAIKTAHISHHLATPAAEFVGVTPSDILAYDLPTDKLNDRDVEALKSELTDPRFSDAFWQEEITTQLKIKKKSEQQALAKYGLDFVTDTYLPEKLGEMGYMR